MPIPSCSNTMASDKDIIAHLRECLRNLNYNTEVCAVCGWITDIDSMNVCEDCETLTCNQCQHHCEDTSEETEKSGQKGK
jgi:hypothetical protein